MCIRDRRSGLKSVVGIGVLYASIFEDSCSNAFLRIGKMCSDEEVL